MRSLTGQMKQGVLLFLLAILLGCTSNKRVDNSPIVEGTDSVMVAKGYDEVELFKTRTGHITATLSVNGKPCIFLIDTGGGATLIDKSKKYKFGLEASKTGDYAAGIGGVFSKSYKRPKKSAGIRVPQKINLLPGLPNR